MTFGSSRRIAMLWALMLVVCASVTMVAAAQPASAEDWTCRSSDRFDGVWGGRYTAWYPTTAKGTWDAACWLVEGDSGEGVRVLQQALNACYNARLDVDGKFGFHTRSAMEDVWREEGGVIYGEYTDAIRSHMDWPHWHTTYEQGWHSHCIDNTDGSIKY